MAHFYKYVTAGTGRIVLESGMVRWSTPALLNDPFDMQFAFQVRCDLEALRPKIYLKIWQHYFGELLDKPVNAYGRAIREARGKVPIMTLQELIVHQEPGMAEAFEILLSAVDRLNTMVFDEQLSNSKIFCVSDLPTSILMWSYYAQNHSGLVLRFNDDAKNNLLEKKIRPVRYVDHMPALFDEESLSDFLAGYGLVNPQQVRDNIIWTKSSHWAHEHERRLFTDDPDVAPFVDMPFGPEGLDAVIFGVRTSEVDRSAITEVVKSKYPHAELLQARLRPDVYELTIGPHRP
jgi:hypothetical protein